MTLKTNDPSIFGLEADSMEFWEDGIVILSSVGLISYANDKWKECAPNSDSNPVKCAEGIDYLKVCDLATGEGSEEASAAAKGIRDVINGNAKTFKLEYPCQSYGKKRWFLMKVQPLSQNYPTTVLLQHIDITEWKNTESDVLESEILFQTVFNNMQLVGLMLDSNGNILFCNDFLLDLTGWKREDVLNKNWFDVFLPAEIVAETKDVLLNTIENADQSSCYENEIITRDGDRRLIVWNNTVFKDGTGNISSISSIGEDITGHRFAEKSLLNSKGQLRALVDTIPDLVWLKDVNGVYLTCNSKFERFFGAKEADIVGKTDYDFVGKELADFFTQNDRVAMEAGKPTMNEETLIYSDDGHMEYVETIKSPMYDSNGRLNGVLGVGRDITQRKQAENVIRKRELQLHSAQKVGRFGSWVFDFNSGSLDASEEALRIYGLEGTQYTFEDVRGVPLSEYRPMLDTALIDLVTRKLPYDVQYRIIRQNDGEVRYIHSVAEYFAARDAVIGSIQDITESKQAEDALLTAKLTAEAASRAKSEFLATMSHELRTPLNSIFGFSQMLHDQISGELNEKQIEYVSNVLVSSKHLMELINGILDLSKVEAGKMELGCEKFKVFEIIYETLGLMQPAANIKNIDIETKIENDDLELYADKKMIKDIMYNLLSNAIKFTPENGEICVKTSSINGELQVSVSDNGIGISKDEQQEIFTPFKQVDSFLTRKVGGTGLGLAIMKRYVEMHGGNVTVESSLGNGSTFTFVIPLYQKEN
ncbi:PAS domain S-box protein [Methanolobus sp. ZRKC3]|uniref:PAS domain-containing sensor histidine kinase n=1 Tax=Methanolobus sp. ZRKC3 TaxID=3125786 RepID=UPI0032554397